MQRFSFSLKSILCVSFIFTLLIGATAPTLAISPQDVPNPRQVNGAWVADMADMLSPAEEAKLNGMLSALEAENGDEMAVVTVPDTAPAATPKAFATELFNQWEIGKAEKDNGVLFLVSEGDRRVEIEVGYGLEGLLTDAEAGEIIRTKITPQFKKGNFDQGILKGTESLVAVLNGETLVPVATQPTSELSGYWGLFIMLGSVVAGSALCLLTVGESEKSKRNRRRNRNRRAHVKNDGHQNGAVNSNVYGHSGGGYSGGGYSGGGGSFGGGSSGGGGAGGSW